MNNRNAKGEAFSAELIQKVWEKAQLIDGEDPQRIRRDLCGAVIQRDLFGKTSAQLSGGWEIDHIKPLAQGGTDDFLNLQPLQWENNRNKGNAYPNWLCCVIGSKELNRYV